MTFAIVRGFLDVSILGLPETLSAQIDRPVTKMQGSLF
jgi:hypothetical protein